MDTQALIDPRSDPRWIRRYLVLWLAISVYGIAVFRFLNGPYEVWFEGAFFAAVYPLILWPLFVAKRPAP